MRKVGLLPLSLIALFGVFIRIHDIGRRSLWSDELEHLYAAQAPIGELLERLKIQLTPPFDYFVTHILLKLEHVWPYSFESLVRLPACVASVAALLIICRDLSRTKGPMFSKIFLGTAISFSAFLVNYAQECRPYSLVFLLSYLSFRSWQHRQWFIWGFVNCVGVVTHYFFPLLLAAQLTQSLMNRQNYPWRILLRGYSLAAVAWLANVPIFLAQLKQVATNASYQYGHPPGFSFVPSFLSQFVLPFDEPSAWGWLFLALAVVGAFRLRKRENTLLFWAAIPTFIAWGISQFAPVATTKNMMIVFYPFLTLAIEGASLPKIRWAAMALALLLMFQTLHRYETKIEKEDYRAAARLIAQQAPTGTILMEQEYGFGPVYLSRLGVEQARFTDFWVPDWQQEPKRSAVMERIEKNPPTVFLSRELDFQLEMQIVRAAHLNQQKKLSGLLLYWRDPGSGSENFRR